MNPALSHRSTRITLGLLTLTLAGACASTPDPTPFEATQLRPGKNETVKVDRAVLLFDASGSIDSRNQFPEAKALAESFVAGMPDGQYRTAVIAFGGDQRDEIGLAPFSRQTVAGKVSSVNHLGEDTPLPAVLDDVRAQLQNASGQTAIVLFTDGLPSVASRAQPAGPTLTAARQLLRSQSGRVCFHTVQVGDDPAGAALLRQLAELTPCGSTRTAASIQNGSDLLIAQRYIFVGASLPEVAAVRDDDRDGIANTRDRCPRTPVGAEVDANGCWALIGVNFAVDSSALDSAAQREIDDVARILKGNPDIRVRIEAHTDSDGAWEYNQKLSERRGLALEQSLRSAGVDPSRMDVKAVGEAEPIASNSTAEGRSLNRRAQLMRTD